MKKEPYEKRQVRLAAELERDHGHFNTYSAVKYLNDGKPKSKWITGSQLLLLLRKKMFLKNGKSTSTEDPDHNKPHKAIVDKGWAYPIFIPYVDTRKNSATYGRQKTDIFAVYTQEGIKEIEKAVNNPDYSFSTIKMQQKKTEEKNQPTQEEIEKDRAASEAARKRELGSINWDKAS